MFKPASGGGSKEVQSELKVVEVTTTDESKASGKQGESQLIEKDATVKDREEEEKDGEG